MSTVIGHASTELFRRPSDERFETLEALNAFCVAKRANAKQAKINLAELEVITEKTEKSVEVADFTGEKTVEVVVEEKPAIVLPNEKVAHLTPYSFAQLARAINVSPDTLNRLPAHLTVDVLNYGLKNLATRSVNLDNSWEIDDIHGSRAVETNASLLYRDNGSKNTVTLDGISGDTYGRFFDAQLSEFALELQEKYGLHPLPASPLNGSRGLYASDRDVWIGLVDNTRRVFETDPNGGLSRMVMMSNSEVNASSIWMLGGFYGYLCANHNFWDAETAFEINLRHTRNVQSRFDVASIMEQAKKFLDAPASQADNFITACQNKILGATNDDVIDELLRLRNPILGKKSSKMMIELAEKRKDRYGNPRSVWGIANAITEKAQDCKFADARNNYEMAAKQVFAIAA